MKTKITIDRSDITTLDFDAIVNAANNALLYGGGVCGVIFRAAGSKLEDECKAIRATIGERPTGTAVITSGGKLPARHVIHAVGPVYRRDKPETPLLLGSAYRDALRVAVENGLKTVAFPNISTGIYGYPKEEASEVAIDAVLAFLAEHPDALEEVRFVCFDEENYALYQKRLVKEGLIAV